QRCGQAIQRVDRVQVELQRVCLPRRQSAQVERVAATAEPAEEIREGAGCAGIDDVLRPCGVGGATLEVVGEDCGDALANGDVVDAPALVADTLHATVREVDRAGR